MSDEDVIRDIEELVGHVQAIVTLGYNRFARAANRDYWAAKGLLIDIHTAFGRLSPGRQAASASDAEGLRALRNRLSHQYVDVNRRILWQVMRDDLPRLVDDLNRGRM